MKRIKSMGFILTETLIVSVVLLVSFIFVFTQFLNIFAHYQSFERYHNIDSLYAAKNLETFLREDNYNGVITALNNNIASNIPYYDFTSCSGTVFTFTTFCTNLIDKTGVTKALFSKYDVSSLLNFDSYTNNFSHELKEYIKYLGRQKTDNLPNTYRVIVEMEDGTFATFTTTEYAELTSKPQFRYKTSYVRLNGSANSTINISGLSIPNTLTIDMWAKANGTIATKMLWSFNGPASSGPDLYFSGNRISLNTGDGTSNPYSEAISYPTVDEWHHYAVTFNQAAGISELYVDGQHWGTASYREPTGTQLYIGRYDINTSYNWVGDVREVKVWNKVLTPTEVLSSMNGVHLSPESLLYYYKLSEGSGTTLIDYGAGSDVANALANVTWHTDNQFSDWIDGDPPTGMYGQIERRTLYHYNNKWRTEDEIRLLVSNWREDITKGLVGYWKLDGNAIDHSGNNNNGTIYNATPDANRFGMPVSALKFNGTNSYVDVGSSGSIGISNSMTISAWVKMGDVSDDTRVGNIIGNYNVNPHTNFEGSTNGRIRFYWNAGEVDLYGTQDLRGKWHHVLVIRDTSTNKSTIYVDGKIEASKPAGTIKDIQWPLRIGGDFRATPGIPFNGVIDDVRIYNRALTPPEVQFLYLVEKLNLQ